MPEVVEAGQYRTTKASGYMGRFQVNEEYTKVRFGA